MLPKKLFLISIEDSKAFKRDGNHFNYCLWATTKKLITLENHDQ